MPRLTHSLAWESHLPCSGSSPSSAQWRFSPVLPALAHSVRADTGVYIFRTIKVDFTHIMHLVSGREAHKKLFPGAKNSKQRLCFPADVTRAHANEMEYGLSPHPSLTPLGLK